MARRNGPGHSARAEEEEEVTPRSRRSDDDDDDEFVRARRAGIGLSGRRAGAVSGWDVGPGPSRALTCPSS